MIAANLAIRQSGNVRLVGTKIPEQIRAAEFVIESRATDRTLQHDLQRRCHPVRVAERLFPRLCESRNVQMRHRETGQTRFGPCAESGGAFVTDLAAGTGGGAGKRRNRGRMIVRLDFHQDVQRFVRVLVLPVIRPWAESPALPACNDSGVVRIRRDHAFGTGIRRAPDHAEELFPLPYSIDDPVGAKYLVPAMLGICLREHHQLCIRRITA